MENSNQKQTNKVWNPPRNDFYANLSENHEPKTTQEVILL